MPVEIGLPFKSRPLSDKVTEVETVAKRTKVSTVFNIVVTILNFLHPFLSAFFASEIDNQFVKVGVIIVEAIFIF